MKMFTAKDCDPLTGQCLEGRVLVLRSATLIKKYRTGENQLWRADCGFGCHPTARGRALFATCLADGESSRWNRGEFIGILKPELVEKQRVLKPADLKVGMCVRWKDPDASKCSGVGRIVRMQHYPADEDSVISLKMKDEAEVEALPCELERPV